MKKKQFKTLYPRNIETANGHTLEYCGIRCSMEVLGGKWKLLIIAELFKSLKRYSELKRAIPEISEKMLISSLQELEHHNIVVRKPDRQSTSEEIFAWVEGNNFVLSITAKRFWANFR
jgi:DNA-binding HxlR family transcriptional regulator